MVDVTVIAATSQVQGIASTPGTGEAHTLPNNLPPQALVSGTIVGRDQQGNFLLRTQNNGTLSLHSDFPLTYNSDVVIRLNAAGTQSSTNARIVSVNGEAFHNFSQAAPAETDSVSNTLLSLQSAAPASETGQTPSPYSVRAIVISTPDPNAVPGYLGSSPNPVPVSGTEVTVHLPQIVPQVIPAAAQASAPEDTGIPQQGYTPQVTTTSGTTSTAQPQAQPVSENMTAIAQNITEVPSPQLPAQPANPANDRAINNAARGLQAPVVQTQPQQQGSIIQQAIEQVQQPAPSPLYAAYTKQSIVADNTNNKSPNTTTEPMSENQPPPATPSNPSPSAATTAKQDTPVPTKMYSIQGQVLSLSKDFTLTVQTASGPVIMKTEAMPKLTTLTPGTTVTIEVPENALVIPPQIAQTSAPAPLAEIAASWNTLKDIIAVLNDNNTQQTNQTTSPTANLLARLPNIGDNFMTSSMSFITAFVSGDVRKILGDDVINKLKDSGHGDLLVKFVNEMSTAINTFNIRPEQATQNWQTAFLPFVYQGEVQQARIYVKRDGQNKKGKGDSGSVGGTRFIVEVSMPELGGVQMDGLIRRKQANTIFDLMIRSGAEFTQEEQNDITSIYNNVAAQTGFSGNISFQVTNDFPVKPLDEILSNTTNALIA